MPAVAGSAETRDGLFASTRWSLVLEAGANNSETAARAAMSDLCRIYWPAIYAYVRRHGYTIEDAQDLTQSFFQHLLENQTLRRASRRRGRFRNFLLGALKLSLADEQARRHTLKRGGAVRFVSVEELEIEELHHRQVASDLSPDESLDARWARLLLDRAIAALRCEFAGNGKASTFEVLSPFLGGEKAEVSYQDVADRLDIGTPAVKTLIYRLRRQFATAVRREIMQTVSAPHEVDDELRQLRMVFARTAQRQVA
ncbi:MAG: sigma-70 family RNA polymerase sigma factor [Chthoniobacterales bacterium]|nr:sigma-70 family RNA polymerase sigma factor [Chthoniobacterales bacterium]